VGRIAQDTEVVPFSIFSEPTGLSFLSELPFSFPEQ
jgi:hypothetical protein